MIQSHPSVNVMKYEMQYQKNHEVRKAAKNFNLPQIKKLGEKIINDSFVHRNLINTCHSMNFHKENHSEKQIKGKHIRKILLKYSNK